MGKGQARHKQIAKKTKDGSEAPRYRDKEHSKKADRLVPDSRPQSSPSASSSAVRAGRPKRTTHVPGRYAKLSNYGQVRAGRPSNYGQTN